MIVWEGEGAQGTLGNGTQGVQKPRSAPNWSRRAPKGTQPPPGPGIASGAGSGGGGTPLSPSPGEAALWRAARTDGSLQDSWTRPQAESSTQPLAQGQSSGAGAGTVTYTTRAPTPSSGAQPAAPPAATGLAAKPCKASGQSSPSSGQTGLSSRAWLCFTAAENAPQITPRMATEAPAGQAGTLLCLSGCSLGSHKSRKGKEKK